jgi:hypothetical protein
MSLIILKPLLMGEDFEESDLPFKVDILDWARASEEFKAVINRDKILLKLPVKIHNEIP